MLWLFCCLFFFFKQKTAYEMRISDWSSDVCSSDLGANLALIDDELVQFGHVEQLGGHRFRLRRLLRGRRGTEWASADHEAGGRFILIEPAEIGRASCRERVCQYV